MALTQVKSDGIATGAVTATQIATGAVTANDLEDSGVTAGTYGSSSAIPAITVDAKGRITSASTSSIDSTAITNGTSNVSVAASGDITATRAGTTRLTVTSTGIDVTGSVTCDGLTSDGSITVDGNVRIRGTVPILTIQDTNNTSLSATAYIQAQDSAGSNKWLIGDDAEGTEILQLNNLANSDIRFATNNTNRARVDANGHFKPEVNNTYDLGTSTDRWRNVYTNDLNLSNEGGTNDVDGTWGSWTIQEGEDDLFLLNRRNGKKYKFALTEVN